ncbi:hypothetical protein NDU88_003939 [Pleurodeles waltl]|uniref:Uncharacterized protein n=1 Tax=Pleurodeles waltl TaxID=8319 RepID=A0AAV7M5I3_PLEWA|nr:hypothetical protein NDU88_003939 [Pleurodeles waltl]
MTSAAHRAREQGKAPGHEYHIGPWQVSGDRERGHVTAHPHQETDRVRGVLYPRLKSQVAHSATVTTYETEGERVHLNYEEDSLEEAELVEDERQDRKGRKKNGGHREEK